MADVKNTFSVTIVTPYGTRAQYTVSHLRAPGAEGDFGVLAGHIPFLTALRIGELTLETTEGVQRWALSGGFAEVLGGQVNILAESAELADSIDLARAEAAKLRALERLAQHQADTDIQRARTALARALNRIRIAGGR